MMSSKPSPAASAMPPNARTGEAADVLRIVEGIEDHIAQYDRDWRYTFITEKGAAMVGKRPDELLGRRIWDLFPEAVDNDYYRMLHRAVAEQSVLRFEHFYTPWQRWYENHIYPVAEGVTVFSVDITERKLAQVDARQADEMRARLAAIVESSEDAIIGKTPDGIVTSWNEGATRIFGYSPEEMIGRSVECLFPDDRMGEEAALLAQVRSGRRVEYFESVRRRKDGTLIDIAVTLSPVRASDGAITGVSSVARDVTARKAAERQLQRRAGEQAALYRLTDALHRAQGMDEIYAAGIDAVIAVLNCDRASILLDDGSGCMRFVAWRGLSDGYRRAVEGHSPWRRDDADPQPVTVENVETAGLAPELAAVVLGEGIRALAFIPLMLNGRLIGKFMTYYDRVHAMGPDEVSLALTVGRQLTFALHRRQAEDSLKEADRRKDEFLATLAHELRNPLAPIRSALELMRLAPKNGAIAQEAREVIERQTHNLVRLVDDLLDISRISRNRLELQRQPLDLREVLQAALETSAPLMRAAGHQLAVQIPSHPVTMNGDPVRLAQAFSNLLNNAAKYTEPGGRVELRAEASAGGVEVRVRDNGIGIRREVLPDIFGMFVQGDGAPERSRGGLGVGLSLVRRLIQLHGGRVEAHSAGQGQGSEFRVWLPTEAVAAGKPVASAIETPPARRVLVADDNRDAADSLVNLLRLQGHAVRVAYDGHEAVTLAREFEPEFALLDLGMPRLSGYDAAERIRALGHPVRLVALTGWGQDEDRRRARAAGFDRHYVKPLDPAALQVLLAEEPPGRESRAA